MSAAYPNSGDREVESLRRAQRAHEPSMEEILASIRNMIVDEREADKTAPSRPVSPRSAPPAPQIVYSKDDPAPQRSAQAEVLPPAPEVKPLAELKPPPQLKHTAEAKPAPEAKPPQGANWPKDDRQKGEPIGPGLADFAWPAEEGPLMSPEAGQAVASAFDALSANLAARGAEIAQTMAREVLRPMLKAWLDENLPGIVERLVRAEIERVARGIR
jgi:hypothetical protein